MLAVREKDVVGFYILAFEKSSLGGSHVDCLLNHASADLVTFVHSHEPGERGVTGGSAIRQREHFKLVRNHSQYINNGSSRI